MAHKELEGLVKATELVAPIANTDKTSSVISLANAQGALLLVDYGLCAGTCSVTVMQKNSVTAVTKALSPAVAVAATPGLQLISIDAAMLDVSGGFDSIYVVTVNGGGGALVSVVAVRFGLRWTPPSVIT